MVPRYWSEANLYVIVMVFFKLRLTVTSLEFWVKQIAFHSEGGPRSMSWKLKRKSRGSRRRDSASGYLQTCLQCLLFPDSPACQPALQSLELSAPRLYEPVPKIKHMSLFLSLHSSTSTSTHTHTHTHTCTHKYKHTHVPTSSWLCFSKGPWLIHGGRWCVKCGAWHLCIADHIKQWLPVSSLICSSKLGEMFRGFHLAFPLWWHQPHLQRHWWRPRPSEGGLRGHTTSQLCTGCWAWTAGASP